jgi:hypothetical protein
VKKLKEEKIKKKKFFKAKYKYLWWWSEYNRIKIKERKK